MRIGIDLGGTKIEGILLADDGTIHHSKRIDTPAGNYHETIATLCRLIDELQTFSTENLTVGIGTPGTLARQSQLMKNCNSICLNGQPLKKDIEEKLRHEIRIENDANCFTLSEAHYGAGRDVNTVFGAILGTGTGGGLVINKRLHNGRNGIAGEWGHNSIPSSVRELIDSERICYCGRSNCIETVLSGRGLKQTSYERFDIDAEAAQIAQMAEEGVIAAIDCVELYSQQLARCLATVVNIIDPDLIVLGGGLSNIDKLYHTVPDFMKDYVFTDTLLTKLSAPSFGDASGALGAACLWPVE